MEQVSRDFLGRDSTRIRRVKVQAKLGLKAKDPPCRIDVKGRGDLSKHHAQLLPTLLDKRPHELRGIRLDRVVNLVKQGVERIGARLN